MDAVARFMTTINLTVGIAGIREINKRQNPIWMSYAKPVTP
jgi:hypothetical protein